MVGTARCAVPDRVVAGGMNMRATLAFEEVAPLHAARTSQRDVPTTLNAYKGSNLVALIQIFFIEFNACVAQRHLDE